MKILSIDCGLKNLAICIISIDSIPTKRVKELTHEINEMRNNEEIYKKYKEKLDECYKLCFKKTFKIHSWENINMFALDSRLIDMKCSHNNCKNAAKYHNKYTTGLCMKHYKKHSDESSFHQIKEKNVKLISYKDISTAIINNLKKLDDDLFKSINKILIEQQPSKNSRLKNFQMMLYQYLVIRTDGNIGIHFVSPKHKLRGLGRFYDESKKKGQYHQNKEVSVKRTMELLEKNEDNQEWYTFLQGVKTKKDDYCDCFLQAYNYYEFIK